MPGVTSRGERFQSRMQAVAGMDKELPLERSYNISWMQPMSIYNGRLWIRSGAILRAIVGIDEHDEWQEVLRHCNDEALRLWAGMRTSNMFSHRCDNLTASCVMYHYIGVRYVIQWCSLQIVGIDEHDERRGIFRSRNQAMRDWAGSHPSGRVVILDFDSLSWTDGAPPGLIGNWTDWHYGAHFATAPVPHVVSPLLQPPALRLPQLDQRGAPRPDWKLDATGTTLRRLLIGLHSP